MSQLRDEPRLSDAKQRTWRTAVQFMAVFFIVDAIPILQNALGADELDINGILRGFVRVALGTAASFLMRFYAPPAWPAGPTQVSS